MEPINFSFFISKSDELKASDMCMKLCFNRPANVYAGCLIPRIQLLASFLDIKNFSLLNIRALNGLIIQIFQASALLQRNFFGLKNSNETIQFWQLRNSIVLKYFWLYCPNSITSKLIPIGVQGEKFKFLRFLAFDIFNFFGGEFYQFFYINYFDFPGIFAFDFFWEFRNQFVNGFEIKNTHIKYLRIFSTFFKCLLVLKYPKLDVF